MSCKKKYLINNRRMYHLILGVTILLMPLGNVFAERLYEKNSFTLDSALEGGAFYADGSGINFGAGHANTGESSDHYNEYFIKPHFDGAYGLSSGGAFYSGVSFVGVYTGGNGDFSGFTMDNTSDIDFERYVIGYRNEMLDVSVGKQDLKIGDGFLIWDGNFDNGSDGGYWLQPRFAFDKTAIAKIDYENIHADLFWLESAASQGESELFGGNVEYATESYGTFAAMYLTITDTDDDLGFIRDGLDTFSVRVSPLKIPAISGLEIYGEYVTQFGDGENGGVDTDYEGDAWYIEPQYTFSNISYSPKLTYRYSVFSGDDDATDGDSEAFDPLFYGFGRGWGTWFQGEIAGEYLLFNTNQNTHMFKADIYPTETTNLGVAYYINELEEDNYFGTPLSAGTDKDFSKELNIYLDWYPSDKFWAGVLYATSEPDDAAEDIFGDDDDYSIIQVYGGFYF